MDVFGAEEFYSNHLKFVETVAFSANFEMFGIGDKNFINNSGPYLVLINLLIAKYILGKLINLMVFKYIKFEIARKIGIHYGDSEGFIGLWRNFQKLYLESYFDNIFCILVNYISMIEAYKTGDLELFFSNI